MGDQNKRATLIEAVIAGGLIAIGIPAGQLLLPLAAVATGVGSNWAHSLAQRGFQHWRERWFTDDGVLNHDITKALRRAFVDAVRQMEHDWRQHRYYQYLRRTSPEKAHLTLDALRLLREDGANLLQQPNQLAQVAQQEQQNRVLGLLYQDEFKATEYLKPALDEFLYGHDHEFVTFVAQQFGAQWVLRFLEILKDPGEEGTRAWRACQLLWQKSLTSSIGQIQQTTAETADTVRWLQAWAQQLKSLPPTQRNLIGQDALETTLHSVHTQLDKMQTTLDRTYATTLDIKTTLDEIAPSLVKRQAQPSTVSQDRNRQRMLERVRSTWITGVLEHSLHDAALIALGLHEKPGALANPWRLVVQEVDRPTQPLADGTRITEVYDGAGGGLLILGEPGAGKTTLLLELARDLLDRAQKDENLPIPVVFNLSSWAQKRPPLADWLVEELYLRYQVPRTLGQSWVDHDQLLLLLDGLDEVSATQRGACIQAINSYRQVHPLVPLVVCSRRADYLNQAQQLRLQRAVVVQPLTPQQIDAYLASAGEQVASVRVTLRDDPVLQELATTPLMLNILILTYRGAPLDEIIEGGSVQMRQNHLFASYVQHMLKRRHAEKRYTAEQTTQWLSRLANQMKRHSQTIFYLEQIQPTWFPTRWNRWAYRVNIGWLVGLLCMFVALLAGLIFGMSPSIGQPSGLLWGLIVGSFIGLVGGFLSALRREITPAERVTWSWKRAGQGFAGTGLVVVWLYSLLILVGMYSTYVEFSRYTSYSSDSLSLIFFFLALLFFILIAPVIIGLRIKLKPFDVTWSWKRARQGFGGIKLVDVWLFTLFIVVSFYVIYIFASSLLFHFFPYHFPSSYFVFLVLLFILFIIEPIIIALRIKLKPLRITWSWKRALWGFGGTGIVFVWLFFFFAFLSTGFPIPEYFVLSVLLLILLVWIISGLRIKLKPISIAWWWERALRGELVVVCLPALLAALLGGPLIGLFFGLSGKTLDKSTFTRPNEGIRRSARNSILSGTIVALILCGLLLIVTLIFALLTTAQPPNLQPPNVPKWHFPIEQWISDLLSALPFVLPVMLILVLITGLIIGGLACIQHIALRLFLQKEFMPWNYAQFLDYAAERILLRKVGGGYIFIHRLFQEYFASLETIPTTEK